MGNQGTRGDERGACNSRTHSVISLPSCLDDVLNKLASLDPRVSSNLERAIIHGERITAENAERCDVSMMR